MEKNNNSRALNPMDIIVKLAEIGMIDEETGKEILKNLPKSMETPNFADADEHLKFLNDRENLKKYLENSGVVLDKDDFEKIRSLVIELENQAAARALVAAGVTTEGFKADSSEGNLNNNKAAVAPENVGAKGANQGEDAREAALNRLNTASSRPRGNTLELVKKFTLEEVGKMSPQEFKKHEAAINKQLREGTI